MASFGAGDLPLGGHDSLQRDGYTSTTFTVGLGTPTNFAGDTFLPPGVPDSGVQLLVEKLSITGGTLNLQWDFDDVSLTSITSFQSADGFSRGDIDGGVVNVFETPTPPDGLTWTDTFVLCPFPCLPARTWPGEILIPSLTQDGADTDQFTQEFRLASNGGGKFNWQIGAFYFSSDLVVETENFASAAWSLS